MLNQSQIQVTTYPSICSFNVGLPGNMCIKMNHSEKIKTQRGSETA